MLASHDLSPEMRLRALRSIRVVTTSEEEVGKYLTDHLSLKPELLAILFNQLEIKDVPIICLSEIFWILANLAIDHNSARFFIKELNAIQAVKHFLREKFNQQQAEN